ncbi:3-deoxy-D-manno-octulosonate 8-phosphate phosphatase KdsC [compost metagenome]
MKPAEIAYVGDDLVDLPAMAVAGLPIAVADAHPKVLESAQWVTRRTGGRGAAREVCEMLLEAQGLLEERIARYRA